MRYLACLASLALAAPAFAQPCVGAAAPGAIRVTVEATNVRSADGEVAFTVYPDDKSKFLVKGGKLARARVPAVAGTTRACFWLTPGGYPIAIYHDANRDHDFNRTLFVPREGYGLSNDVPASMFSRPSFEKARVMVDRGTSPIRIRMRYP